MSRAARAGLWSWPWLLAVLALLPNLAPGYVLSYDMVFVPDLAVRSDFLGFGTGLPRAVPSDLLVALLDEVVPAAALQKLLLLGALGLAGTGVQLLVPRRSVLARLVAASAYVWNPYVAERLVLGHWPLLLAYAALPWVAAAAWRSRGGPVRPGLVLWLALGATSAAGGVMTAAAALAFGTTGPRRGAVLLGWALAVNAPWMVAGAAHAGAARSDAAGVSLFAAGPEGTLPAWLAVVGLGGVWNAEVVPAGREGILPWAALALLVVLVVSGVRPWAGAVGRPGVLAAGVCAALGLVLAWAGVLAPAAMSWLVVHVPGAGLFRDGSRYLGLWAVVAAPVAGYGATALADRFHGVARRVLAVALALVPVALLLGLALGAGGRLRPADFPPGWAQVRAALVEETAAGDLLVLPFTAYRAPAWNHGHKVLDPLGRYLPRNYLAEDELRVSGQVVAGEDPRARRVRVLLRTEQGDELARALAAEGIGYVATDTAAPGARDRTLAPEVPGRDVASAGGIGLVALAHPAADRSPGQWRAAAQGAAWAVAAAALAWATLRGLRRLRGSSTDR